VKFAQAVSKISRSQTNRWRRHKELADPIHNPSPNPNPKLISLASFFAFK